MKWSIEKQTTAGLSLASAVLIGINVLSYWSFSKYRETAAWVTHTQEVLQNLEITVSALKDAETGQRGYVITGEEHYLEPYYRGVAVINQEVQQLKKLTADNPNQQQRLNTLEPLVVQTFAVINQTILLRRHDGFAAAQNLVKTNQEKHLTDHIRLLMSEMEDEENQLLRQRLAQKLATDPTANRSKFISSAGIVFSLLLLYLIYYTISRETRQRRQAQAALQKVNTELETRVTKRTEELKLANQQLLISQSELRQSLEKERELSELKSRIVTTISHEYRTPLTTILMSAKLLEQYSHQATEEKKRLYLDRIQVAVKRMTNLVSDVLFIGKAEAEKLEFQPALLELEKFCRELVEEIQLGAGCTHIITFVSSSEYANVYLDERLLRQIITNLLSNAIKYSPQGGTVRFSVECVEGVAKFYIQDEGIGIPTADQQQIFEFFHRASNVGTLPGTGLGLAIVKKCVDLHGGQISVESFVNVGTTFTVMLPFPVDACCVDYRVCQTV